MTSHSRWKNIDISKARDKNLCMCFLEIHSLCMYLPSLIFDRFSITVSLHLVEKDSDEPGDSSSPFSLSLSSDSNRLLRNIRCSAVRKSAFPSVFVANFRNFLAREWLRRTRLRENDSPPLRRAAGQCPARSELTLFRHLKILRFFRGCW